MQGFCVGSRMVCCADIDLQLFVELLEKERWYRDEVGLT